MTVTPDNNQFSASIDWCFQLSFRITLSSDEFSAMLHLLSTWTFVIAVVSCQEGILYPRESETREIISLNGIWNFVASPIADPTQGFREEWFKTSLTQIKNTQHYLMPVPSSYNDISQNWKLRDHVGEVWYDRTFFVPKSWETSRVWLRFSSVSYAAHVWLNGNLVMKHEIGHLPFQKEVNSFLNFGGNNQITVACNNILNQTTVPQGKIKPIDTDTGETLIQTYKFDFFNYAGIDRPVALYTTPATYIDDVTVQTDINGTDGIVHYKVNFEDKGSVICVVTLFDKFGTRVATMQSEKGKGTLIVPFAKLWWPYLMDEEPGYMYTLQIELTLNQNEVLDIYRQPIGIRTIQWTNTTLLLNNRPIYLHGFGRHEDADIRGKGLDLPTIVRDHDLIKWVGGNAYRTSHYPYAEEIMDLADQLGIMIVDECPSVAAEKFKPKLLENHKSSLTQLIKRDKNRPSVIMWSVANEPQLCPAADNYFREIVNHVKSLDSTRPTTMSVFNRDQAIQYLDIISFNHYNAWYDNTGRLDTIINNVIKEATSLHEKFNRPVLISEYGADTIPGLHSSPSMIWSEEYQVSLMSKHFKAFDILRAEEWFIGEFIWNFADFMTSQKITRVGGNKKGIFTRDRQPKASAHHLRKRYFLLAQELYNTTLPDDLFEYLTTDSVDHDEL